ncbi:MAG: DUF924 family protein [Novosphingobium sp.]
MTTSPAQLWCEVLDFWFPEGRTADVDADSHRKHWFWRLRGGADEAIVARFSELTARGAEGELDGWANEPEGRLSLIIVLDQFARSLWRGTPRAFAQDPVALKLAMDGLANGHYDALDTPWFKIAHTQPLGHCEGPDHLARIDLLIQLREEIASAVPDHLQPIYRSLVQQAEDVCQVITTFGRHPHRNQILGRQSTPAEKEYLQKGDFPHLRAFQSPRR